MIKETNAFGNGELLEPQDLEGKIFGACTACMSIYAEFSSWARVNNERIALLPQFADHIVVLSCQVTDLAILNDLKYLDVLIGEHPNASFYIGGCLARRFDIDLPEGVRRIDNWRSDYTAVPYREIFWARPFWVKDFQVEGEELDDGHMFRDMYPLRISVGCKKNCAYCSIKHTRGQGYELNPDKQIDEFINHDDVLLIADSPSADLIRQWCDIALDYGKPISIRNVEPSVALECMESFEMLSLLRLLRILHVPVQSDKEATLKAMRRSYAHVTALFADNALPCLKCNGVTLATNVIVDYKHFPNPDMDYLKTIFDYVSWNPYWDGKWNREVAEQRFAKYLGTL